MCRITPGALALAAVIGLAGQAHAGLIPAAITVASDGGNYRFKYNIHLPSDYKVKSGDFFTIYDFHGLVPGGNVQPAGWLFSSALLGPNPPRIMPGDNAAVANLTWTYSGPEITATGSLGNFEAVSTFGPNLTDTDFASQDHRSWDDRPVGNYTIAAGPEPKLDPPPTPHAPEPATLALLALGIPVAGLARWLRRRWAA